MSAIYFTLSVSISSLSLSSDVVSERSAPPASRTADHVASYLSVVASEEDVEYDDVLLEPPTDTSPIATSRTAMSRIATSSAYEQPVAYVPPEPNIYINIIKIT